MVINYTRVDTFIARFKKMEYLRNCPLACLIDLPRTKKEAQIFQRNGIIPTHVIQLIVSDDNGTTTKNGISLNSINLHNFPVLENWGNICTDGFACRETCNPTDTEKNIKNRRYLKNCRGLLEAYRHCLIVS